MKRVLIICTMLAGVISANAQSVAMTHSKWEENDNSHRRPTTTRTNEFANLEMTVNDGIITFSYFPVVKKAAYAVVTNGEGEFIKQMKITPEQNTMSVRKLRSGLYFVTIVYRNESKKAFTMNL